MIKIKSTKLLKAISLWGVILLSCILNLWNLWNEGLGNLYYAAGVKSMSENLHAFFFNSLDSTGFVTIDKPPLGFWIQVLFTKVLGFNGLALLLPEAIAGVLSVYLLYRFINKRYGAAAGFFSALTLAVTPIFVAVSRNNTIDGILILLLILASEQAIRAAEKASVKHLIFSAIFIGLGFNVKMLQAYMIVPAIYLTYLLFANQKIFKKLLSCLVALIIMLAISLSWVITVELIPAENRPYVGSSQTNSELNLALGYNGLKRLMNWNTNPSSNEQNMPNDNPNNGAPPINGRPPIPYGNNPPNNGKPPENLPPLNDNQSNLLNNEPPMQQAQNQNGPGAEAGTPSVFRLFTASNAGQISWFILPSLAACLLAFYLMLRNRKLKDKKNTAYYYWSFCFLPMLLYYSFSSGLAHRYYFATFAPAIAALVGIGVYCLTKEGKSRYILPIAIFVTGTAQIYIQAIYKGWFTMLLPIAAVLIIIATIFAFILIKHKKKAFSLLLILTLFILPAFWSFTPIIYGSNAQLPIAGPELAKKGDLFDQKTDLSKLIKYLDGNRQAAKYIAAVPSAMDIGAQLIIQSNEPVMVLGGFNGGDKILTAQQFADLVAKGEVKYALIKLDTNGSNTAATGQNSADSIDNWIIANGELVDTALWAPAGNNNMSLYELK